MGSTVSSASTWQLMWRLTLPVLAEEWLTLLVGYTDWWLAGHYLGTADHLAAMSLLSYVMWMLNSLFAAVAIGATALVARVMGSGDQAAAVRITQQALLLGAVLAALFVVVAWLAGPSFIHLLQLRGEAADLLWRYVRIVIPAIPFMMLEQVAAACLRGAGDTFSGFTAKALVNVVNMIVSPVLLLGLGPAPRVGWEGLAIGTVLGHCLGGTLLLAMLLRGRRELRVRPREFAVDRVWIRRLLWIGVPGALDVAAVLSCHLAYVAIINSLGTDASAAHGLGLQVEALSYLPGTAFHVAAATMAGQYLGAGQGNKAWQGVWMTCLTGCAVMSCAALAFVLAGDRLAGFFTGDRDNETARQAAELLKIVALSTPSLGVLQILTGGLRGAGDTRWPLLITLVGLLGVRLPGALLLSQQEFAIPGVGIVVSGFGWGVAGAWWAMTADVILRSLLVAVRFFEGGWKHVQV